MVGYPSHLLDFTCVKAQLRETIPTAVPKVQRREGLRGPVGRPFRFLPPESTWLQETVSGCLRVPLGPVTPGTALCNGPWNIARMPLKSNTFANLFELCRPFPMLSYHDVVLYESDVAALQGPRWLNDQIVAFYYEYLTHEVATESTVVFLTGAQAFFVMNGDADDVLSGLVKPLGLKEKELIFLAVNDNPDVERAEGGMHWSLLVWDARHGVFVHLDSCGRMNRRPAMKMAMKLYEAMGIKGDMQLLQPSVPQQKNAYDCALYLLKFTGILSQQHTEWSPEQLDILQSVTQHDITQFRGELLDLIEDKRKK